MNRFTETMVSRGTQPPTCARPGRQPPIWSPPSRSARRGEQPYCLRRCERVRFPVAEDDGDQRIGVPRSMPTAPVVQPPWHGFRPAR